MRFQAGQRPSTADELPSASDFMSTKALNMITKIILAASLACFGALAEATAAPVTSGPPYDVRNDIISARLALQQSTVREGLPVVLSVALHNGASSQYYVSLAPPWVLVHLRILDSRNREVKPSRSLGTLSIFHPFAVPIDPGSSLTLSWPVGVTWLPLENWGYALVPGTYSIQAVPSIFGFVPNSTHTGHIYRFVSDGKSVRSNAVTLTISR